MSPNPLKHNLLESDEFESFEEIGETPSLKNFLNVVSVYRFFLKQKTIRQKFSIFGIYENALLFVVIIFRRTFYAQHEFVCIYFCMHLENRGPITITFN